MFLELPKDHVLAVLLCFAVVHTTLGVNILYICPLPSPSHHIWNKVLALELVNRGHNVTMLTHDKEEATPENFTVITMDGVYEFIQQMYPMESIASESTLDIIMLLNRFPLYSTEFDFNSTGFKTLLTYPRNSFDLIIKDVTPGYSLLALAEIFNNPPIVAVSPFLLPFHIAPTLGSPIFTSFMPFYGTTFSDVMSLKERIINFIYVNFEFIYFKFWIEPLADSQLMEFFPQNTLTIDQLARRVSILLANIDPIMEYPVPLSPNIIPVGGLHAKPSRPLPKNIKKIMDEAKEGAIIFSLGTNLKSNRLEKSVKMALLKAFSKLPQTVFWKFETDDIDDLPKNVIIQKWLPQNDLIGHPNTVLFIGHGGLLSTQEAIYHGVPIIGIPFALDQHANVQRIVNKGIGLYLDRQQLTFDNIYGALTTILKNPKYRKTIKSISRRYKSQPQTALEKAVFWIDHVIEHGGAEHLSTRARDLSWCELAKVDVLMIFLSGLLMMYWVFSRVVFRICNLIRPSTDLPKIKTT